MNTPAHVVASLLVLGSKRPAESAPPIIAGSLAPDAPMFVFYFVERIVAGRPERIIWSEAYYEPAWQDFFDVFNSIPLIAVLALVAWLVGSRWTLLFAASMGLHALLDWPLHHDDGHRHLYPLSDWRFASPVSYWDPAHYGTIVAPLEALFVLVGCGVLWRRHPGRRARVAIGAVVALYAAYIAFALIFWVGSQ